MMCEQSTAAGETKGGGGLINITCSLQQMALAHVSVLASSMATVMGPTPPGTGVMSDATALALSKSTSPTMRRPVFFVSSADNSRTTGNNN